MPRDSKPGVPYASVTQDNDSFISDCLELIVDLVLKRLNLFQRTPKDEFDQLSPEQLVQQGFADPVRVFVKGEPHSKRKVESGRWRLIFAVSLVDQLLERLLTSSQNKKEIQTWMFHPSAPGLGLSDDNQLTSLYDRVMQLRGTDPLAEADVTGWDWSVKEHELVEEAEQRILLGHMSPLAAKLIRMRFLCVSRSVYAMPDGVLLTLVGNGVQLSGTYCTSSSNSRIRVVCALRAGARWAIAMGDDCLEDWVDRAPERYAAQGHPLKMYEKRTDTFEFCSTIFSSEGAWPVDGTKCLFRLIEQKQITPEFVHQFKREMRNHPRFDEFLECVARVRAGGQSSPITLHAEQRQED